MRKHLLLICIIIDLFLNVTDNLFVIWRLELGISNEVAFELFGMSAISVCSDYLYNTTRDLVTGD